MFRFDSAAARNRAARFATGAQRYSAEALLITCADTALDECLLPRLQDQGLLVWRSEAHMVPPYGAGHCDDEQAIDEAVRCMDRGEIIVCGHLACTALESLLDKDRLHHASNSLQFAHASRRLVEEKYGVLPRDQFLQALIEENVLVQMANLRTYPAVLARLARGDLQLHCWIYDRDKDTIYAHEPKQSEFLRRVQGASRIGRPSLPYVNPCEIYLA